MLIMDSSPDGAPILLVPITTAIDGFLASPAAGSAGCCSLDAGAPRPVLAAGALEPAAVAVAVVAADGAAGRGTPALTTAARRFRELRACRRPLQAVDDGLVARGRRGQAGLNRLRSPRFRGTALVRLAVIDSALGFLTVDRAAMGTVRAGLRNERRRSGVSQSLLVLLFFCSWTCSRFSGHE